MNALQPILDLDIRELPRPADRREQVRAMLAKVEALGASGAILEAHQQLLGDLDRQAQIFAQPIYVVVVADAFTQGNLRI